MNWINVKDKLPEEEQDVWVMSDRFPISSGTFYNGKFTDNKIIGEWQHITHWAPMDDIGPMTCRAKVDNDN